MMFVVTVSVSKVTCSPKAVEATPPPHPHLHISAGCDQFSVRCSPHSSHQNPRKARDISDYKSTSGCYIRLKGQQLILILSKTLVPSGRHSGATAWVLCTARLQWQGRGHTSSVVALAVIWNLHVCCHLERTKSSSPTCFYLHGRMWAVLCTL